MANISELASWYGLSPEDVAEVEAKAASILANGEVEEFAPGERTYDLKVFPVENGEITLAAGYSFAGATADGRIMFVRTGMTAEERESAAQQMALQAFIDSRRAEPVEAEGEEIQSADVLAAIEQALQTENDEDD